MLYLAKAIFAIHFHYSSITFSTAMRFTTLLKFNLWRLSQFATG